MHVIIAPSILAADLGCLKEEIARAVEGGCDAFHLDIMDHHFVPNLSFGPAIVKTVRQLTTLPLDVHLMVDNPMDMIKAFADAGGDSITFHIEVVSDVSSMLEAISHLGVKKGISLKPDTPVSSVIPYLDGLDILLVMTVYPGFGGQSFLEESYSRIREIVKSSSPLSSPPLIAVDGGVDLKNAPLLVEAGVDYLVAGTSVFKDHGAVQNVRLMRSAVENRK
ncbi:MAG: ribulose-phosphate 3-epimerase [Candidatus Latescibacterota bacterium]